MSHYSQRAQALVLRLPEHLEEGVRQRLRDGSLDGVQLTARLDGVEGLRESSSSRVVCVGVFVTVMCGWFGVCRGRYNVCTHAPTPHTQRLHHTTTHHKNKMGLADFASKHGVLDLQVDDESYPARIGEREGRKGLCDM